jgi:hypothetical protein
LNCAGGGAHISWQQYHAHSNGRLQVARHGRLEDGAAALGGEISSGAVGAASCGNAGCPGLSTRQVRTPFSSLQTGQMWLLGHGFPSCACATTLKS